MRALLCEPMGEPTDDFIEPIAVEFNETGREPGFSNVFFFCDSKGNLRHSMSGKILVLGIKNELPCSLTDEQVKRYSRAFRSSVLYFQCRTSASYPTQR